MNSYMHAVSAARKWGGDPLIYLPVEEFIDGSKRTLGDARHRAMYHHTEGVWLCQQVFGVTLDVPRDSGRVIKVPVRLIAERHILEDLGWLPSFADYMRDAPLKPWMSGTRRKSVPLSHLLLTQPVTDTDTDTDTDTEGESA